jgi:hypothetical protein
MAFDEGSGTIYGWAEGYGWEAGLMRIDPVSAAGDFVGRAPHPVSSLTFDQDEGVLHGATGRGLVRIDPASGTLLPALAAEGYFNRDSPASGPLASPVHGPVQGRSRSQGSG